MLTRISSDRLRVLRVLGGGTAPIGITCGIRIVNDVSDGGSVCKFGNAYTLT